MINQNASRRQSAQSTPEHFRNWCRLAYFRWPIVIVFVIVGSWFLARGSYCVQDSRRDSLFSMQELGKFQDLLVETRPQGQVIEFLSTTIEKGDDGSTRISGSFIVHDKWFVPTVKSIDLGNGETFYPLGLSCLPEQNANITFGDLQIDNEMECTHTVSFKNFGRPFSALKGRVNWSIPIRIAGSIPIEEVVVIFVIKMEADEDDGGWQSQAIRKRLAAVFDLSGK